MGNGAVSLALLGEEGAARWVLCAHMNELSERAEFFCHPFGRLRGEKPVLRFSTNVV